MQCYVVYRPDEATLRVDLVKPFFAPDGDTYVQVKDGFIVGKSHPWVLANLYAYHYDNFPSTQLIIFHSHDPAFQYVLGDLSLSDAVHLDFKLSFPTHDIGN